MLDKIIELQKMENGMGAVDVEVRLAFEKIIHILADLENRLANLEQHLKQEAGA